MEQASNGLKLTDLNDFINPSKSCIKPLITEGEKSKSDKNETVLLKKKSINASTNTDAGRNVGKIKLDDCLACSGCVTSAEVVFIEQQSISEFMDFLSANNRLPDLEKRVLVVSISPQSVLSLAHSFNLSVEYTINLVMDYFKNKLGAQFVFNHLEINHICLRESSLEFVQLFDEALKQGKSVRVFSSSCPGWACYAEKRCQNEVVDQLSRVRSIQGVMGGFVKRVLPLESHKIYHLAVMPCFDRKLEAARPDMVVAADSSTNRSPIKETDIVVTTYELYQQLVDTYNLAEDKLDRVNIDPTVTQKTANFDSIYNATTPPTSKNQSIFHRNIGGESGGLAINIFITACQLLYNVKIEVLEIVKNGVTLETVVTSDPEYRIAEQYIKSSDYHEFWLEKIKPEGPPQTLLRFAKVYGFRSIQSMLIRLKKLPSNYYQYIEVMACPNGGCLNGGGQVLFHTQNSVLKKNQLLKEVRNHFGQLPTTATEYNKHSSPNDFLITNQIPTTTTFRQLSNNHPKTVTTAVQHQSDTSW